MSSRDFRSSASSASSAFPRIGVLGGTFDPPHVGHLVVAQEVRYRLGLERVLLIPAAIPPHKRGRSITPGALRLEMLEAAVDGRAGLEVSDLELRRDGPSYTVDTLRELGVAWPDAQLFLILGADQLAELDTWREAAEVRRRATMVGIRRLGEPVAGVAGAGGVAGAAGDEVAEVPVPRLDISSTDIRRRLGAGEPVDFMVPDPVLRVIQREGLYRDAGG